MYKYSLVGMVMVCSSRSHSLCLQNTILIKEEKNGIQVTGVLEYFGMAGALISRCFETFLCCLGIYWRFDYNPLVRGRKLILTQKYVEFSEFFPKLTWKRKKKIVM